MSGLSVVRANIEDVNPDLIKERENCPFDVEELANYLKGGPENRRKIRHHEEFAESLLDRDVVLESLSAEERYESTAKILHRASEASRANPENPNLLGVYIPGSDILFPESHMFGLHAAMFLPTIEGQGTNVQKKQWVRRAKNFNLIGAYAQTELGHGTFLRGLETTATFDRKSQEFILHSPSISAFKWWPGGLGKTATHAVVMADLITQGKSHGPHAFIVPLRDVDTFKPFPGVKVGDIGTKLGMKDADHGFVGFDNYRIPRSYMLMKHSKVNPDGTYENPPRAKLGYGTMVMIRCMIARDCVNRLKKATTIAIRYSAVRHQSELIPGQPEPKIIEYQTQQEKLFPALALAFGIHFAANNLWQMYTRNVKNMSAGDFALLPELHAVSCGLKALASQEVTDQIDVLRRSCGGHGFMASSGFPKLWGMSTATCTYEGENTVMLLQCARSLVKVMQQVESGSSAKLSPSMAFLAANTKGRLFALDQETYMNAFANVTKGQLKSIVAKLREAKSKGLNDADAWNDCLIELTRAATSFTRLYVVSSFNEILNENRVSFGIRKMMKILFETLAVFWIGDQSGDFIAHANFVPGSLDAVNKKKEELLSQLRPLAVSIVDGFDLSDASLHSALGAYDGQVYKRLFAEAAKSPLNKSDVQPAFDKYLKPLLKSNL